ncbi:MAG: HEAT repeat domain-containing protein [Syntrophaceae bacterium]|nr:HEAT repeat domain-containing protein [Syntrophaceae bacterium]
MNIQGTVLEDTKKLFSNLLLTYKNVSLYPESHSISLNSIRQLHEIIEVYIRQYGDIRIEVERDRVICQEIEVHKGRSEEGSLPFTLFRDGIRWLKFTSGIKLEETSEVLSIIHRYSVLATEPEGDIVTAFWEAHFDHVLYKADDFISEQDSDQIDKLSKLETTYPDDTDQIETEERTTSIDDQAIGSAALGGITIDPSYFILTPQEETELQEMVAREEKASITEHLNMLLDMLLQIQEEKDFKIVLGVLLEEFEGSYHRQDYEAALIVLDGLRKILGSGRLCTSWAGPLLESFYKDISSDSKCLKPLENIWSNLNLQQMIILDGIFKHLHPRSVTALMHLFVLGQPSQLEQIVENTIIALVRQDISCLESLINNSDEKIAEKLVLVLSRQEADKILKYLLKLARHSSATVRRMAIKTIGQAPGNQTSLIFEFINDPDVSVRRVILAQMALFRNEPAEDLLIQYLQNQKFSAAQAEHIMECFQTLGKCGSIKSVAFLSKTLMHQKWMAWFKKSAYREGAAQALAALKIPEARQVIETAGRSFYPGLRGIARKAGKEFFQKNRGEK